MLFYKSEYFENTDMRIINLWSTQFAAERAEHNQLFGNRIQDACDKFGIKNSLALFCYSATISVWFSKAPKDHEGKVKWCEDLAEQFSKLDDIRLMPMTEDQQVIMTLVWTQATTRLNEYAKFKKPREPKLPDPKQPIPKPVEVGGKKDEEEEPKREPEKPVDKDKEEPAKVAKKSNFMKIVGIVAGILAALVAWLPIPAPLASLLKVIFNAIASIFK
jgi:hypothetical protein